MVRYEIVTLAFSWGVEGTRGGGGGWRMPLLQSSYKASPDSGDSA